MSTQVAAQTSSTPQGWSFDSLEAQLEQQALLATIATRFISLPDAQIDAAVGDALSAVGRFTGTDRVILATISPDENTWSLTHEWFRGGLWSLIGRLPSTPTLARSYERLRSGEPFAVLQSDHPEPDVEEEAQLLTSIGLGSFLALPVHRDGRLVGFAAVANLRSRGVPWPPAFVELLGLLGRMLLHALARRATERAMLMADTRWKSLCDSNVVGAFVTRKSDGVIIESNDAGLRLLGRSREELEAEKISWFDTTVPEQMETDLAMFEAFQRTGRVLPWEKDALRPDGSRVPVLCSLASLGPDSDELLSISIDLSSRRRVEAELKRRDEVDRRHAQLSRRLIDLPTARIDEALADAISDVARLFGFDGAALYDVDAAGERARLRSLWLEPASALRAPTLREASLGRYAWWLDRLRRGRSIYIPDTLAFGGEARAEREALRAFGIVASTAIPLSPAKRLCGFLMFAASAPRMLSEEDLATLRVFGDILANAIERQRVEHEIAEAVATLERRIDKRRGQLETSNAELEAFAYSVSHDLRAPLRQIAGMCKAVVEDYSAELGDDARALLDRIEDATERMSTLIDGLLQLSRVVRTPVERGQVDVSALATEVAEELALRHGSRNVAIEIQPNLHVIGHARLLRIALAEVFDNAFKFTRGCDSPRIALGGETTDDGRTVVLRLRDNGVGFPSEFADKLFGAFRRLHGVDQFEGHGIGLATVHRIVRMHGGEAWAESRADGGATVSLSLPTGESVAP